MKNRKLNEFNDKNKLSKKQLDNIIKSMKFYEQHSYDFTQEFKDQIGPSTSSNVPLNKRLRYFEHLINSKINKQWLADKPEFIEDRQQPITSFIIPLKREVFENSQLDNDNLSKLQKLVFDALNESECYIEFIDSDYFNIMFDVNEDDATFLFVDFSNKGDFLKEAKMKKKYTKKQITEAIAYWKKMLNEASAEEGLAYHESFKRIGEQLAPYVIKANYERTKGQNVISAGKECQVFVDAMFAMAELILSRSDAEAWQKEVAQKVAQLGAGYMI